MSYGVDAAFKKVNSIQEMQRFISELKQKAADTEIIKEIVDKNKMCLCYGLDMEKIAQDGIYGDEVDKLKTQITKIFTFKWCYIDMLNNEPFGYIIMFGVPSALHPLFDGIVYFQNSTDQDYNKKDYDGIPELEAIYDKVKERELQNKKDIYDIETEIYNIIAKPVEDLLYEEKMQTYMTLFNESDDMLTIAKYVRTTVSAYEKM